MKKIFDYAKALCAMNTVSGYEQEGFQDLIKLCGDHFDEYQTTPVGSFVGIRRCGKKDAPKIILDAHFDEIGMIVTGVFDDGFLSVTNAGGIDTRVLSASEVRIFGRETITGVFISKPPHLQEEGESKKKIELKDLYIDTGYSGEKLKRLVRIGDRVAFLASVDRLSNDFCVGKSFDDKICVASILRAMDLLKGKKVAYDIYCLFSGGEEIGYKGATTAAYGIIPDYAIALDVCNAHIPDGDKSREHIHLGNGGVISYSPTTTRSFTQKIIDTAAQEKIPYQLKGDAGRTGTNAHVLQICREGVPTALISLPLRYMHTPSEVICLQDVLKTAELLAVFCQKEVG